MPTGGPASCQLPSWTPCPSYHTPRHCASNQPPRLLAVFKKSFDLQYFKNKLEFKVLSVPQGWGFTSFAMTCSTQGPRWLHLMPSVALPSLCLAFKSFEVTQVRTSVSLISNVCKRGERSARIQSPQSPEEPSRHTHPLGGAPCSVPNPRCSAPAQPPLSPRGPQSQPGLQPATRGSFTSSPLLPSKAPRVHWLRC